MKHRRVLAAAFVMLLVAGCSVRMGGPAPVDLDALVLTVAPDATADQIVALLRDRGAEVAILSGARDSAFYADIATRANLKMTRPGRAGATTFVFFGPTGAAADSTLVGDTTLTLTVPSGGELRVHDALYRIDKNRRLDLMAVRIDATTNLKDAIRTLLTYVATDVMGTASVLLAIEPPTPALGDSVSILTRAAFADAWECTTAGRDGAKAPESLIRVFLGPPSRMRCERAERVETAGNGLFGHFVLPR